MDKCFLFFRSHTSGPLTGGEKKAPSFHVGSQYIYSVDEIPQINFNCCHSRRFWGLRLMMMCEKHFFKLLGQEFTLKFSLPFRSHWVFMNILPVVQVKLKWGGGNAFLSILMTFSSTSFSEQLVWLLWSSTHTLWRQCLFPARPFWWYLVSLYAGTSGAAWICRALPTSHVLTPGSNWLSASLS